MLGSALEKVSGLVFSVLWHQDGEVWRGFGVIVSTQFEGCSQLPAWPLPISFSQTQYTGIKTEISILPFYSSSLSLTEIY